MAFYLGLAIVLALLSLMHAARYGQTGSFTDWAWCLISAIACGANVWAALVGNGC